MAKGVLSKHRKALMLFGIFYLFHGQEHSAASICEKDYPNLTLVISDLGSFYSGWAAQPSNPFAHWPDEMLCSKLIFGRPPVNRCLMKCAVCTSGNQVGLRRL